jgi:hypothetical protein
MERRRTGRDGDSMFRAHDGGEIMFEGIEIGPGRSDPIGLESF